MIMSNNLGRQYSLHAEEYKKKACEVLDSGWYILGKEVSAFEEEWANYIGAKYCVGLASGLDALWISFRLLNIGVGDATSNGKALEDSVAELTAIAGQKPVITKARKSIANFKLREGQAIGTKVTLRGQRMYEFYDKLVSIALPRVRDFRGVSKNAFDGHGNYTLGVREQLIFPEIDYDKISKIRGMDIVIVTTAQSDAEAFKLLELLGMPFKR